MTDKHNHVYKGKENQNVCIQVILFTSHQLCVITYIMSQNVLAIGKNERKTHLLLCCSSMT
jgi:hypothetical protein